MHPTAGRTPHERRQKHTSSKKVQIQTRSTTQTWPQSVCPQLAHSVNPSQALSSSSRPCSQGSIQTPILRCNRREHARLLHGRAVPPCPHIGISVAGNRRACVRIGGEILSRINLILLLLLTQVPANAIGRASDQLTVWLKKCSSNWPSALYCSQVSLRGRREAALS